MKPGLENYAAQLREAVIQNEAWPLHAIAGTLAAGREPLEVQWHSWSPHVRSFWRGSPKRSVQFAQRNCCRRRSTWWRSPAVRRHSGVPTPFWRGSDCTGRRSDRCIVSTCRRRRSCGSRLLAAFQIQFPVEAAADPGRPGFSVAIEETRLLAGGRHRLNQVPTLVGMASIELIVEAAGTSAVSIEDLSWHRPVTFVEGNQAALFLQRRAPTPRSRWSCTMRSGTSGASR